MAHTYHTVITDETGKTIINEEKETFLYGSPDEGSDSQFTWLVKINVLKVFGPMIMKAMKDKVGL